MRKVKIKCLLIIFLTILLCLILHRPIYAASMNMSISKTSGYVGDTFSVTISGINGRVYISANSNVSISTSGSQFVDGSLTITGTAKNVGTGTITVTPEDAVTDSAEPEEVTASVSRNITIKQKEVQQETTTQSAPTQSTTTTASKSTKTTTNVVKTTQEKNEETKKFENFYISTLVLNGINENGEYSEIRLTPEFNKDIYEYECNVTSDIQKIEIQKDAGEFTDSIVITGLEEIKEGENIIKIELIEEGYETKTYTIKVIKDKEEKIEQVDDNTTEEENKKESKMISMPLWTFILVESMLVVMIVAEAIIICVILKKKHIRKSLIWCYTLTFLPKNYKITVLKNTVIFYEEEITNGRSNSYNIRKRWSR